MKQIVWLFLTILLPFYIEAQKHQKAKMILDKSYQIDSVFQPYFGIQQEISNNIALIDEQSLKENAVPISTPELHAVRDPFTSATMFQFSAMHFRVKGLPSNFSTITVNGIPMIDLSNGMALRNLWQGLNGVFRIDENTNGFLQNSFSVSTIWMSSNIDIRASKLKEQTLFDYGFSNRAYNHRFQFTHSSGILKNGWAFSVSAGGEYTNSPNIPGTFHHAINVFMAIDKRVGRHIFSMNYFASHFQNARQGYIQKESASLFDNPLYNPNWGFQNKLIRNANISSQLLPVAMVTHEWKFTNQSYLQTAFAFSTGYKNNTGLNWFHAPDPRPDYYRYMPSFQADSNLKEWVTQALQSDQNLRQINWDKLFAINRSSNEAVFDANGINGNTVMGKMAKYLVENRRTDVKRYYLASSYHGILRDKILFDIGITASFQQAHFYKTVNDLLGADFFVNWNQFAENEVPNNPNAIQFDVQMPNRIVKQGDSYGYDYSILHTKTESWLTASIPVQHFQLIVAAQFGSTQFWRLGNKENGLFPNHSKGKSLVNQFLNAGIKLAINYAINGKQNLYLTAATHNSAPSSENIYISPSTRDAEQENLQNENIVASELGYLIQTKRLKIHASLYYSKSKNGLDILSFYHDAYNSFVNYAISGIGQTHMGIEFGMDAKLNNHFSILVAATNGQHYFNSRQYAIVTADNSATEIERDVIYAKNYPCLNSPQSAYTVSLNMRSNSKWFGSITSTLFDQQYLGWNPIRRTAAAIYPIDPVTEKGKQLLLVEKMPAQSLLNCFVSYTFHLRKKKQEQCSFSMNINNLLNRQNIIITGYEQLRFDFDNKDPDKFPPKYLHAAGRNFLLSFHYSL
jgi:hypothetical protein